MDSSSDDTSLLSSVPSSPPSSPLSSLGSRSPSPPLPEELDMLSRRRRSAPYPSPPASQQTSQTGSPAPDGMDSSANTDADGPPPAKRRRISKERTTEYLDLRPDGGVDPDEQQQLDRLLNVLHKRQKIVVIAGAGISVSAGIPDFRSSQGLFQSLKEEYNLKGSGKHLFDASVYKDDVSTSSFHDMVSTMSRLTKDAKPTAFHHMLATIAQENRLLRLYSQNVDGIDTSLEPLKTAVPLRKEQDGKWPRTVQLHGGLDKMVCSKCQELSDLDPELFTGPVPPLCPRCEEINDIRTNHEGKRSHGIGRLRPRMVLYNEHNPDDEAIGAVTKEDLRKRPDAVVVVGTTLKVPGVRRIVREMCATVRDRRGGVTVWINNDPPPVAKDLEDCWDIIVQGPSDEVARHAAMRKWDDPAETDDFRQISEEDAKMAAKKAVQVQLPPRPELKHAIAVPLPSERHVNNSFKPPEGTPRRPSDRGPQDYSPMATPIPSTEDDVSDGDRTEDAAEIASGLLTPSKSLRNSPAKSGKAPKKPSINDKLKSAKPAAAKMAKKTVAPKKPAAQKGKPAQKKTQTKAKTAAKTTPKITQTLRASKAASAIGAGTKKNVVCATTSPRKLRQSMLPPEPMHTISPQDSRINKSPATMSQEEQEKTQTLSKLSEGRRIMSVSTIVN